ncbi:hypothetical protein BDQ17DRAFT_1420547 [Cyathus striatus]|nr:hypothetical protein BDQ17DRAFT_1420547 [Cyathus striatus]
MQCRGRSRQVSRAAIARQASEERRVPLHSSAGDTPSRPEIPVTHHHRPFHILLLAVLAVHCHSSPLNDDAQPTPRNRSPLITLPLPFRPRRRVSSHSRTPSHPPNLFSVISPILPTRLCVPLPGLLRVPALPTPLTRGPGPHRLCPRRHTLGQDPPPAAQGHRVTSDDDPRIAEVQDEDFDFCFIPHGKLMDEREEKIILERQREEREREEEKRRVEKLRACGRMWEEQKRRLREERMLVLRRRELERVEEERRI